MLEIKVIMDELGIIPTEDLIQELGKRFEHWVFAGIQTGYEGHDKARTKRHFDGNMATCAGLCTLLQTMIAETFEESRD